MTASSRPAFVASLLLLAALSLPVATDATAQVPAQKMAAATVERPPDDASLELGERYAVTAKRTQIHERYEGDLVVANGDWIALRRVSEGRREHSTPIVGAIPYIQRWFRTVSIGRESEFVWIPRSAVSKCERLTTAASAESAGLVQAAHHEAQAAPLRVGTDCMIDFIDGGEIANRRGKLSKFAGGKLTLVSERFEVRERPYDGAKRIPFVGALFTTEELVKKSALETHSLDKVLAIHVPIEAGDSQ
jgi:hypothetical protein